MPADPSLVDDTALPEAVRRLVAEVLIVPLERVGPDSALTAELGAESIDFLDMIFRLEDILGRPVAINRWQRYVQERFGAADLAHAITTRVVLEFAQREARGE